MPDVVTFCLHLNKGSCYAVNVSFYSLNDPFPITSEPSDEEHQTCRRLQHRHTSTVVYCSARRKNASVSRFNRTSEMECICISAGQTPRAAGVQRRFCRAREQTGPPMAAPERPGQCTKNTIQGQVTLIQLQLFHFSNHDITVKQLYI